MNCFLLNNALRWKKFGYRVTVICQDKKAATMSAVNSYIEGEFLKETPKLNNGEFRVVVPEINNLIPIYKSSLCCEFPGMKVKPVQEMTEEEIETNIQRTGKCLRAVIENDRPFKVIANYMLLSGTICERILHEYGIPFDIVTPGPALQYSVKPYKHLWKWVLPGFQKAEFLFQLTHFVKDQFIKCFEAQKEEYHIVEKIRVLNPGINTSHFMIPDSLEKCEKDFVAKLQSIKKSNGEEPKK
jgi:hypothetical protein